jgi:flagellar hook-basal body complex protein FliE
VRPGAAGAATSIDGEGTPAGVQGGFADALKQALAAVNQAQADSDRLAGEFQLGNPSVSVEQVMVAINRANIAFQGAVQVRNRLVAAYNEVMNLSI